MFRSKRFTALLMAVILAVTSSMPSYASDVSANDTNVEYYVSEENSDNTSVTEITDVSGEYTDSEKIGTEENVSDNQESGEEETLTETPSTDDEIGISENDSTETFEGTYKLSVNEAEFVYQFGGLDNVDMSSYIETLEDGDDDNRFYGSADTPGEDVDGAVAAVTAGIENWDETIDLAKFNIYFDGTKEAEEHLVGIVANAVNFHGGFICYEGIESFSVNEEGFVENIKINYADPQKEADYNTALRAAYDEAVPDKSVPALVKAMALHDWLVQHVVYGYGPNQYDAYGAIVDRKCVCMGYALAYGDLLSLAGIEKGYVTSNALNHMWNIVKMDGNWYNVDCTWDDPLSYELGDDRYWNFLKSTSVFKNYPKPDLGGNHKASDWNISVGTYTYYGNSSVSCSSTTYDKAWWNESLTAIVYNDGYYYYVKNNGTWSDNSFVKRSSSGTTTSIKNMTDWAWGGMGKYIDMYAPSLNSAKTAGNYSVVSQCNGYIFFSTDKEVYKYDPATGVSKTIYTAPSGYIWSILACGSKLKILVGSSKGSASTKTVDIMAVSNLKINAGYTSISYGATQTATLKATYDCNKTITSETWYAYDEAAGSFDYERPIVQGTTKGATSITFDPTGKNAGSYKYRFEVVVEDETFRKDITITVNKAAFSIANKNYTLTKTYDSVALSVPTITNFTTNADELSFAWYTNSDCRSSSKFAAEPYKAGTYYLKAVFAGNTNVKAGSKVFTIVIKKRSLAVTVNAQDLLYGQTPSAEVGENIVFTGVAEGDELSNFVLIPSTTELTTTGTINAGSIKILRDGVDVTSSYNITITKGKLTVSKVPVTVTAKNQTIKVGQDISREAKDYIISGEDFDTSKFVLVNANVAPGALVAGTSTINVSGAKVYKKGSSTDVTKYFNITYVPGTLTVEKKTHGTVGTVVYVEMMDRDCDFTDSFGISEAIPADAVNVSFSVDSAVPSSCMTLEVLDTKGKIHITGEPEERNSVAGGDFEFVITVHSDNYEDINVSYNVTCKESVCVTIHGNGGLVNGQETAVVFLDKDDPTLGAFYVKRPLYEFVGWANEEGDYVYSAEEDMDLYACWAMKYTTDSVTSNIDSAGIINEGEKVFLYTGTNGAKIYYTTDGTAPDVTSNDLFDAGIQTNPAAKLYTDGFVPDGACTVKAVSVKNDYNIGDIFELDIHIAEIPAEYTAEDASFYEEGKLWVAGIENKYFNGSAQTQADMRVYFGKKKLVYGTDYSVSYKNNINAGTAKIIITGKGNFTGSVEKTFTILNPDSYVSITGAKYSGVNKSYSYTGLAITPAVTVKVGTKTLVKDVDYTVSYENNVYSGTAKITITGTENTENAVAYVGTKVLTFKIGGTKDLKYASIVYNDLPADKSYDCTGEAVIPNFTIMYKGQVLTEGFDYTYSITNNIKPGNISIKITGKNAYKASKTFKVALAAKSISKATVTGISTPVIYPGYAVTQDSITVKVGDTTLVKDVDYKLTYKSNTKPGTAYVTVTGINCYTGSVKKSYKITAYNLLTGSGDLVVDYDKEVVYRKGGAKPSVNITLDGVTLTSGKDYTVSYSNNKASGLCSKIPTITIKGKNGFAGTITRRFTISRADISTLTFAAADVAASSKQGGFKAKISVKDLDGKVLGTSDYTNVVYTYAEDFEYMTKSGSVKCCTGDVIPAKAVLPAGVKVKVTVEGKGNYYGTISCEYRIVAKSISSAKVTVKKQAYTGQAIQPGKNQITVKVGSTKLSNFDYEIVGYESNETKGYGYVIIRGIGKYSGTKKVKFTIQGHRL